MLEKTALPTGIQINRLRDKKRIGILLDILIVFAPLLLFGGIGEFLGDGTPLGAGLIYLAYVLSIAIATVVLKSRSSGWREIGLAQPDSWLKTVLLGIGTFVGFIVVTVIVQTILANLPALEMAPPSKSNYDPLVGNLPLLILYLTAAWTVIAFGEEMIFRAFLMNGLAGLFQQTWIRWTFVLIGSSIIFGLCHFSWGLAGIIETTVMGLVLGFAYLRSGGNLWVTIIAHGLLNTLAFILAFAGVACERRSSSTVRYGYVSNARLSLLSNATQSAG